MRMIARRKSATPVTNEMPTGRNQKVRLHALLSSPVTKQLFNNNNNKKNNYYRGNRERENEKKRTKKEK